MSNSPERQLLLKQKIEKLINEGFVEEANHVLNKYAHIFQEDKWLLTTKSVIHLISGEVDLAEKLLSDGLAKYPFNADILFNLAYLYEQKRDFQSAYNYYLDAEFALKDEEKAVAINAINKLKSSFPDLIEKQKVAVFVKPGLDNFIDDIIHGLLDEYRVRKILVSSYDQIDQGMEWADICWFEWCDELVIYGSRLEQAKQKPLICRLHRYEAYEHFLSKINWDNIDYMIFVANHIKNYVLDTYPQINPTKCIVINNGINLNKYSFQERSKGFNIAYVGYLNYKKGPDLLLQTFKSLFDKDNRYKLYIAGTFQGITYKLYFQQMVKELGLEGSIFLDGWQNDISNWLADKHYILSTSHTEGHPIGVMEAMARGLKPIIHNYVGAQAQFGKYTWNTIEEAVKQIMNEDYNSYEYRTYIEGNYSLVNQVKKIGDILDLVREKSVSVIIEEIYKRLNYNITFENIGEVTLFLPTYNRAQMVISDINKGHKLGSQKKVIVDDYSNLENQQLLKSLQNANNSVQIVFHQTNQGVAKTFRTAFDNITTRLTQFCGDDDLIFCFDRQDFVRSIEEISFDYSLVIPKYVVNLDLEENLRISYDRSNFNDLQSIDVLKHLFTTGEMSVLIAGAVISTDEMKDSLPDPIFRVSEDYVALARYLSKNPQKKVKVLESYVYIRRVSNNTLSSSSTINVQKLSLHLLSLLISGYYCYSLGIISNEELIRSIDQRGKLLEGIYGFGKEFTKITINYITKVIDIEKFIQILNEKYSLALSAEDIPCEIRKFPYLL